MISIITINFNSSEYTLRLVRSILSFVANSYEILIVDNASEKEDYNNLKNKIPYSDKIQIISNKSNLGFGGGNMTGARQAKGDFLLFVNNDVELLEDSLSPLIDYLNRNPDVGLIGPRTIKEDGSYIRSFGHCHTLFQSFFGLNAYLKKTKKLSSWTDINEIISVDFVVGSFMLFPLEIFHRIGGFDTDIFLYYEEMDIAQRLAQEKIKAIYYPKTTILHSEGKSSNASRENYEKVRKEQQISHNYYFRKHNSLLKYLIWYIVTLIKFPIKLITNFKEYKPLFFLHLKGNSLKYSIKPKTE